MRESENVFELKYTLLLCVDGTERAEKENK